MSNFNWTIDVGAESSWPTDPMPPSMLLSEFVEAYILERPMCSIHACWMRRVVQHFDDFAGQPVRLTDLADLLVNRWLVSLESGRRKLRTVKGYRTTLLSLWRAAWEQELVAQPPRRVRRVKLPETIVEAWTPVEVAKLADVCDQAKGWFADSGIKRASFWRMFVFITWDTALRLGDVMALRRDRIADDGSFVVVQHKTGWQIQCRLRPETLALVDSTYPPARELILPWGERRECFHQHFRQLVKWAGIRPGTSKWLRRASATAVEKHYPGAAMAHLGHKTPGLAYAHYVDRLQVGHNKPMPPPLPGLGV
ncbi:MAG: hypothetical protein U0836_09275 [Pirellulales bacterium]